MMGSVLQTAPARIGAFRAAAGALTSPATMRAAIRFVSTVLRDFFWLQFSVRLRLRRIPIVNVEHRLDAQIPFVPGRIGAYLDFIAFWIRPLGMLRRRFGRAAQRHHAVQFLDLLTTCYRQAAEVYRRTMSTTGRPRHLRGRFLAIHLFDPHYLCVPSLHIMIVVATYTHFRRVLAELGASPDEAAQFNRELFDGAVEIAESVLYIKQHSINCLPAALYAMSQITPTGVCAAEVSAFIDRLFVEPPPGDQDASVSPADAAAIRDHIQTTFDELTRAGRNDPDWPTTVQRFVASFG